MKEKEFKFLMHWPLREVDSDKSAQVFSITARYPQFYYGVIIPTHSDLSTDEQKRLAISELKVRLIRDISCAEFEEEK